MRSKFFIRWYKCSAYTTSDYLDEATGAALWSREQEIGQEGGNSVWRAQADPAKKLDRS